MADAPSSGPSRPLPSQYVIEDIDVEDDTEEGQVLLAARYADVEEEELLEVLKKTPALVNCCDDQGRTPLHMAAANGHAGFVRLLIRAGATPEVGNHEGNTALHYAAANNHIKCAKMLLKSGWKASTRNKDGFLPVSIVRDQRGYDEMESLLFEADETLDDANLPPGFGMVVDEQVGEELDELQQATSSSNAVATSSSSMAHNLSGTTSRATPGPRASDEPIPAEFVAPSPQPDNTHALKVGNADMDDVE